MEHATGELEHKLSRVRALLDAHGLDALRLKQGGNLAWLSSGGDFLIYQRGAPVAEMLVQQDAVTVLTDNIEAGRLKQEELPEGFKMAVADWFEKGAKDRLVKELVGEGHVADDSGIDLYSLRVPLLEGEQQRFRELGKNASRLATDAIMTLKPGLSEKQVAATVKGVLEYAGMACPVLLVAGQERFGVYRHPTATDAPFGSIGLIVVCAERHGLIVSFSRTVAFGEVPELSRERLKAVLEVERAMWDATQPGTPVNKVFEATQRAYAQVGFPDAWKEHHQGGPGGYFPRDFFATPDETRPVLEGVAYAWNPSLPHAKSEDTVLLTQDGLEILSHDPRWPSVEVGGRPRPDILVL